MYWLMVQVLQPYFLLLLVMWLALLNLWRKRRDPPAAGTTKPRGSLRLLSMALLVLTLISIPAVAHLARGTLEWQYVPLSRPPDDAEAIVVLAGSVLPWNSYRNQVLPASDTLYRCLHAADLYRQKRCLVLVSGGKVEPTSPGPPVAEAMADFLRGLGVNDDDLIIENQSRTTYENAVEARKRLEQRQINRIILVTEAMHMPRAERCFRKQGLEVAPAPCSRMGPFEYALDGFLPNPHAAAHCEQAFHEWVGMAWYWMHGRI